MGWVFKIFIFTIKWSHFKRIASHPVVLVQRLLILNIYRQKREVLGAYLTLTFPEIWKDWSTTHQKIRINQRLHSSSMRQFLRKEILRKVSGNLKAVAVTWKELKVFQGAECLISSFLEWRNKIPKSTNEKRSQEIFYFYLPLNGTHSQFLKRIFSPSQVQL